MLWCRMRWNVATKVEGGGRRTEDGGVTAEGGRGLWSTAGWGWDYGVASCSVAVVCARERWSVGKAGDDEGVG